MSWEVFHYYYVIVVVVVFVQTKLEFEARPVAA